MGQYLAHQTAKQPLQRKQEKFKLIRLLYARDYQRQDISELFRFIDWMLSLPEILELELQQEIILMQEEQTMKYVTSWERLGEARGIQMGRAEGVQLGEAMTLLKLLQLKFRLVPIAIENKVNAASKAQLDAWIEQILTAESLESLFS